MIFDYLFLPMLFLIALITSYQDLKFGKIKNKWVILGLVYGLSVLFFFFIWNLIAQPVMEFYYSSIRGLSIDSSSPVFTIQLSYLRMLLINFLISIVIVFLMWYFSAWSAGDAKLFLVFALLLPLEYYYKTFLPFFPSFVLLVNIFIPVFIFISIRALFFFIQISIKKIKEKRFILEFSQFIKENALAGFQLLVIFITMFFSVQLIQRAVGNFSFFDNINKQLMVLVLMFLFSSPFNKVLRNKKIFWFFLIFFIGVLIIGFINYREFLMPMLLRAFYIVVFFLALIGLLKKILDFYIEERGIREINIEDLESGFQIDQNFLADMEKKSPETYSVIKNEKYFQPETLKLIKDFCLKQKKKTIGVYKSFPFAIWMLAGLILTIILKGSFFSLIFKNLI